MIKPSPARVAVFLSNPIYPFDSYSNPLSMTQPPNPIAAQITAHLTSKGLTPTNPWLTHFLSTQKPTTPLPALNRTALFRLLASDVTTSLRSTPISTFPSDILAAEIPERRLPGPIPVQVLNIEDIGRSRWSQLEAIEAAERGETTKGREVIRVVAGEDGLSEPEAGTEKGGGPHKLLLQDARGMKVYGFEMKPVEGVGLGTTGIGMKMVLRDVVVARGVVLLEPVGVVVLGGKIEGLHRVWKEGRKKALRETFGPTAGR